ncbi:kinase-like domain-containing protein [Mycena galopus ATCC 62051]|nr:kinase-like domain-containing protein [Mycena galopus ATCC 62051]
MTQDAEDIHKLFASILRNEEACKTFLDCRDDLAQHLLNLVQDLLDLFPESRDRPLLSRALMRLSQASELHPACFSLADVQADGYQVAAGGFGDIRQGTVLGQIVAVKIMRVFGNDDVKAAAKRFGWEAVLWRQLSHPNALSCFAMDVKRHIMDFLQNAPPDTDHIGRALGVEYLHSKHVVHGDLKGSMRRRFRSVLVIATSLKFQHSATTTRGGTTRYQAPELLNFPPVPNHFGSDVYAFACVCYEILTGERPFSEINHDVQLALQVLSGLRPSRPETMSADDGLWLLLQDCWNGEPAKRPDLTPIVERLRAAPISAKETHSTTDWDEKSSAKFRRSLQDQRIRPSVAAIEQMLFGNGSGREGGQRNCQNCHTHFPERRAVR